MKVANIVGFLVIMLICVSCRKSSINGFEYIGFVENPKNELVKTKDMNDLHFRVQLCPTEYMLLKELKSNELSSAILKERKEENAGMLFFKLRIQADHISDVLNYGINSPDDYYARTQYLSYGFEEDIALVNGNDTLFPALFHFERTYGVAPYADFMVAFDTKLKEQKEFHVLIDDKVFNTGILKFAYNNNDIQNIPQLKTN